MLSGQWQASDVNLEEEHGFYCDQICFMTWKAEAISWYVRVCARTESWGSYKYIFFPELCQYQKERRGMFLQGWKEVGKEGTQRKSRKRAGERTMCLFQNKFTQPVIFGTLAITEAEKKNMLRECCFYFFPQLNSPADRLCPGAIFFSSKGLWDFRGMNKGLWCLCSEMDRLSSTLKKSLFPSAPAGRLSDNKGGAPPPAPSIRLWAQFPRRQSCSQGDCVLHSHHLVRLVEHHYCL